MAIQSKFHMDLSKYEPVGKSGLNKRQKRMILKIIPGFSIIMLFVAFLDLNDFTFWILSFVTGFFLIVPPVLKGLGVWEEYKNKLDFFMKKQDRYYETGQIRRYAAHEFVQKKTVSETDKIGKE